MPYRPTERTEARKAAARETILAAALDQVARAGYASAGMTVIAGRAGVATGTVYRHFPSKADLFAEVFQRASNRELDVLRGLAADRDRPAAERVAACVEAFSRRALAGPVLAYAQIAEPVDPAVEAERLTLRRGYRDVFAGLLREGIGSRRASRAGRRNGGRRPGRRHRRGARRTAVPGRSRPSQPQRGADRVARPVLPCRHPHEGGAQPWP